MSRDQFSIFGFDHVVEVFCRSCVTDIVLYCLVFWTLDNYIKAGDVDGFFFLPSTSGKHESCLKLTKTRQEMPNAASNVNTSQAIGKVTTVGCGNGLGVIHRTVGFLFSRKWSHGG